ncbi:MAG: heme ABC transporter ATP-binding protein CcmA [Rhodospirillaceae bacterium]|nr:heme ABC transporter ATP-binding protein CcmA [Rhodospirillaceae bacterium]
MDQFKGASLDCLRSTRPVFRGLDFDLPAGGALVLTGPNGSGKSSLLRLMAGLLPPAGGTLSWNGEPVAEDPDAHRARLAYLGHLDAVKPALTAAENLAFWAQLEGADPATAVGPALDALAIGHLADLPARFLSAGQKRRLNLARLGLGKAVLWLLDEPATALDVETISRLRDLIHRHRDGGGMVAVSTHSDLELKDAVNLDLGQYTVSAARAAAEETAA